MRDRHVRRYPFGAEVHPGGVSFRTWAPRHEHVAVIVEDGEGVIEHPLESEQGGFFAGFVEGAGAGTRYRFRLGRKGQTFPDPASRFQPDGPHGASQVVDPRAYRWKDGAWHGVPLLGQVLYELHVGTFSPEGNWRGAMRKLDALAELGVTLVEVMPVAEFAGKFGWGYDGVDLFAPTRLYGTPDDFRAFVDRAHSLGLGVILDVVYNHFGPSGCYLREFGTGWFSTRHDNEWGDPIAFDEHDSGPVREFMSSNAAYWIAEFHLDGLRLDATQSIHDDSARHVIGEIARAARAAAGARRIVLFAENEPQDVRALREVEEGGFGLDAMWNDDFHHAARVALTGHDEAYFTDYSGRAAELVAAAKHGFLYQGQWYSWQRQRRGTDARGIAPERFVAFLQNHDQVANGPGSRRIHLECEPGNLRALTAWLLLLPHTPMLFQGQEFLASAPFHYFADHEPELARAVRRGREAFVAQFPSQALEESRAAMPRPEDEATFRQCVLDWDERRAHAGIWQLHHDLLKLRREDPVLRPQARVAYDAAALSDTLFLFRWFAPGPDECPPLRQPEDEGVGCDRLLLVNLGRDVHRRSIAEPLLAPPRQSGAGEKQAWRVLFSTESVAYGGIGSPTPEAAGEWRIQGHAAVLLA